MSAPTLDLERSLVAQGETLVCVDEVGRGALAGPVSVGMVVIDPHPDTAPEGIRDSKDLSLTARERLAPLVSEWVVVGVVGHASPAEVDAFGIVAALRLAGRRAWGACLAHLNSHGLPAPRTALLDGNLNWLSAEPEDLFGDPQPGDDEGLPRCELHVVTQVKGDRDCIGVGAASILAKVERDGLMNQLDERYPVYGWGKNKGYGSSTHRAAILQHGASDEHRRSWKLI